MSRKLDHNYVHSKVRKSMFHFICQISYLSTIRSLFNQSYIHHYLLLWFYFDLIGHFEFHLLIIFYYNILHLLFKNSFHLCHSIQLQIFIPHCYFQPSCHGDFVFLSAQLCHFTATALIVFFRRFSMFPHCPQVRSLVGFADYIGSNFPKQSYYRYLSSIFFSNHNSVVSPSTLLIVIYLKFVYDSSPGMTDITSSNHCLHWNSFDEILYCCHI